MGFVSPLSTTIVAPATSVINYGLHNTNAKLANFIVTVPILVRQGPGQYALDFTYDCLAYVVGVLILGPASEVFGRRPVLSISNWTLAIFEVCCAVAPDVGFLVAIRFLGGIGGAGCLTLIGALCADLFVVQESGAAGAISGLGIIFDPQSDRFWEHSLRKDWVGDEYSGSWPLQVSPCPPSWISVAMSPMRP